MYVVIRSLIDLSLCLLCIIRKAVDSWFGNDTGDAAFSFHI